MAASRLARRTRYAAIVATVLALMAGAGAFVGFRGQQEATRHAVLAQTAEKEALAARDEALHSHSLSLSLLSQQTAASGDTEAAILLALETLLPTDAAAQRRPYVFEAEAALYQALLAHHQARIFKHDAAVTDAAFNRTGNRIVTSSYDKNARIWDVSNGAETVTLSGHGRVVERAEFSPDGSRVITAARDDTARVWDAVSGKQLFVLRPVGRLPIATFSPSGDRVLTAGDQIKATLWDARTGEKVLRVESGVPLGCFSPDGSGFATAQGVNLQGKHQHIVSIWNTEDGKLRKALQIPIWPYSVAFSPDGGRMLISGWGPISYGNVSRLFDLSKETEIATFAGHKSDTQLKGVTFSHDGRRIATVSLDGSARLWDGASGKLLGVLGQETPGIKLASVAADDLDQEMNSVFNRDDRYLATTSLDHMIRIWDVDRASLLTTIKAHTGLVEHVEFSPVDNDVLLTASHDGTARLWDLDGVLTTTLRQEYSPTFAVFSPDNVHLVTGGGDAAVHLWNVVTGRELARLDTHTIAQTAAFSPDGTRIAAASLEGQVLIWDVASRHEVTQFRSRAGVLHIQFSPDGALLSSASMGGTAQLWDAARGAELAVIKTNWKLQQIVFSRDGSIILAATGDNPARLLKPDGTELKVLSGHQGRISAADFSPDGQLVATASLDRTARIWSIKDGSSVATLKGHSEELTVVSFSRDGRSLLTASRDGTVRIWSVPDGIEKVVLRGHSGDVTSAQFSPTGAYVITASFKDRTVRLWEAQSGRQMAVLASREVIRPALTSASFSSDGTRIAIVSSEESARIVHAFPTLQDLIVYAKQAVPRELTGCERRRFFLPVEGEVDDCPS